MGPRTEVDRSVFSIRQTSFAIRASHNTLREEHDIRGPRTPAMATPAKAHVHQDARQPPYAKKTLRCLGRAPIFSSFTSHLLDSQQKRPGSAHFTVSLQSSAAHYVSSEPSFADFRAISAASPCLCERLRTCLLQSSPIHRSVSQWTRRFLRQ